MKYDQFTGLKARVRFGYYSKAIRTRQSVFYDIFPVFLTDLIRCHAMQGASNDGNA